MSFGPDWLFAGSPVVERATVIVVCAVAIATTSLSMWSPWNRSLVTVDRFPSADQAEISFDSDVAMALVLTIAMVTGITTVGFAAELSGGPAEGGSGYTELSLLTEDENGTLVATDYPLEYRRGEARTVYVSVGNREGETLEYILIAKLQRVDETGESTVVQEETELARSEQQIQAGETYQFEHDVRPSMTGSDLRIVYLLYEGQPPETPTTDNAYRSVHLRINVTAG